MKMKAALRYSAKPIAIGLGILFFCTALLRLAPTANITTPVDMLFFFLMGALTFPHRTDILMQCGVSREKQYAVLWGLCLFAVSASVLDAALQGFGSLIFDTAYSFSHGNIISYYRTWYTPLASTLLYGVTAVFRNIAAMFSGHLIGILAYRFLRAGSRFNIILPCILTGCIVFFGGTNSFSYMLSTAGGIYTESECIPIQFMYSPIRWGTYFWIHNFLYSPSAFGDSILFTVAVPLFYMIISASLCCILLRNLPIRRGLDA